MLPCSMVRLSHCPSARHTGESSDPLLSPLLPACHPAGPEERRKRSQESALLRSFSASPSLLTVRETDLGGPRATVFPRVSINIIPWHLLPLCFHTLTRSFALRKTLSPILSVLFALFAENTRGGVSLPVLRALCVSALSFALFVSGPRLSQGGSLEP
jgi:hypothetical protein